MLSDCQWVLSGRQVISNLRQYLKFVRNRHLSSVARYKSRNQDEKLETVTMPCRVVLPLSTFNTVMILSNYVESSSEDDHGVHVLIARTIPSIRRKLKDFRDFAILDTAFKLVDKHRLAQVMEAAKKFLELHALKWIWVTKEEEDGPLKMDLDYEEKPDARFVLVNNYESMVILKEDEVVRLVERQAEMESYLENGLDMSDCCCDVVSTNYAYHCVTSQVD